MKQCVGQAQGPDSPAAVLGACALSTASKLSFGAWNRVFTVCLRDGGVPASDTAAEISPRFRDAASCVNAFSSTSHASLPPLRKSVSDGSIPPSPSLTALDTTAAFALAKSTAAAEPDGSPSFSPPSGLLRPLHVSSSIPSLVSACRSSGTSQRKRKQVSFAPDAKMRDGAARVLKKDKPLIAEGLATPGGDAGDEDQSSMDSSSDQQEDDSDDERRPKRQGMTAEEICLQRKMELSAAAVAVPILKLPTFPFGPRAFSAPTPHAKLPTMSVPSVPLIDPAVAGAATPAGVSSASVPAFPISTPESFTVAHPVLSPGAASQSTSDLAPSVSPPLINMSFLTNGRQSLKHARDPAASDVAVRMESSEMQAEDDSGDVDLNESDAAASHRMLSPQQRETIAIYKQILPQALNSPASFTSLSLLSYAAPSAASDGATSMWASCGPVQPGLVSPYSRAASTLGQALLSPITAAAAATAHTVTSPAVVSSTSEPESMC
jgi:hypothetical protein